MIRFEKVPFEEYAKSRKECFPFLEETLPKVSIDAILQHEWNNIKLPKRATSGSAGYDIFAPFDFTIPTYESCDYINRGYITLPTGIRFVTDHNDIALIVVGVLVATYFLLYFALS